MRNNRNIRAGAITLALAASYSLVACGGGGDGFAEDEQSPLTDEVIAASANIEVHPAYNISDLGKFTGATAAAVSITGPVFYTPQQIRAAYNMPPVLADTSTLTAEQAAALGAGQTIYVIGMFHSPNIVADLNTFNSTFNLPGCTEVKITATGALPPARKTGCDISVVYSGMGSRLLPNPPAYSATWAKEYAIDVQWAHATAPMARIVVIESLNNFVNAISDSIVMANRFGPGAVSMSFVANEWHNIVPYDFCFQGAGMTYLAATGDRGMQANWPAVSPAVLAVGGTTMRYDGVNPKVETAWAGSGGGYSAYFKQPAWQSTMNILGSPRTIAKSPTPNVIPRSVPDVSFNADPMTGQVVAVTLKGGAMRWYSVGGTSLATPQWAGIIANANAQRALAGVSALAKIQESLYSDTYSNAFSDITVGNDGTCVWCYARPGYDTVTGWGTPNLNYMMPKLINN